MAFLLTLAGISAKEDQTVWVSVISPDIVKITYTLPGQVPDEEPSLVSEHKGISTSKKASHGNVQSIITTGGIEVTLNRSSLTINGGKSKVINIEGDADFDKEAGTTSLTMFTVSDTRGVRGAGERGHSLDFKGDTIRNYNRQNYGYTEGDPRISMMNITMPLYMFRDNFAILFDDYCPSDMFFAPDGHTMVYSTENGCRPITFYYIQGHNRPDLVANVTSLTGRQEMPPLWSLGYITSKYGYRTQAETMGVIDTLQRKGYPVDGIVLDLYWYGKEQDMGALSWEKSQWPDHKKMLADLKKKGVNLVAISQPYVLKNGRGIDNYRELSEKKMFGLDSLGNTHDVTIWVGEGGMFDVSNPDTRQWLTDRYRQLTDEGITGWWGDLGEPEVHPLSMIHSNGEKAATYHNRYGNDWSEIIYDLFKTEYPDRRLMTMMRGGTIGLQKYNVFPWSTDVSRSWGGLQPQVKIMINSGESGLGYMSHDVGGFAIDQNNPVDPELYVRWLQLGTFSPILRTHAQQVAEPYKYPEQQHIIKALIKERYRWLPYNYTLAYENASQGLPMVRAIDFHYSGLERKQMPDTVINDEYLWGRDVLIAPVMQQGATTRRVYFPDGSDWTDLNDPLRIYSGNTAETVNAPLDVLPMYVRAGSFIPTADYQMKNTGSYKTSRYTVNYYPAGFQGESEGYIYEDDMTTPNDGSASADIITFTGNADENGLSIRISISVIGNAPEKVENKNLTFKIYNVDSPVSAGITLSGKELRKWNYDPATRILSFNINYIPGTDAEIKINF